MHLLECFIDGHPFIWKMIAIEPRSVMEAKRWIGRIVFGTIGVEMAGLLVRVLVDSVNH